MPEYTQQIVTVDPIPGADITRLWMFSMFTDASRAKVCATVASLDAMLIPNTMVYGRYGIADPVYGPDGVTLINGRIIWERDDRGNIKEYRIQIPDVYTKAVREQTRNTPLVAALQEQRAIHVAAGDDVSALDNEIAKLSAMAMSLFWTVKSLARADDNRVELDETNAQAIAAESALEAAKAAETAAQVAAEAARYAAGTVQRLADELANLNAERDSLLLLPVDSPQRIDGLPLVDQQIADTTAALYAASATAAADEAAAVAAEAAAAQATADRQAAEAALASLRNELVLLAM